jgi:membrane protease YdiL (CAAX protease family)
MSLTGSGFALLPITNLLFQLFGVALPEEVYFRGFLQERLGNNVRGLFIVSILFAVMHLPKFIMYADFYSAMTFFPSLVMGFLYWRTSNIIPCIIFHFMANAVFLGFL